MTSEILDNYNKTLEEQDICPKFGRAHDYEQLDQQFISKNIVELDLICLQCGIINTSIIIWRIPRLAYKKKDKSKRRKIKISKRTTLLIIQPLKKEDAK